MAFDIYAGGFARFYAREWENLAQRHARETGMDYTIVYPEDDPGPSDWDEVAEVVQEWKAAMLEALGEHAPADAEWSEGRDAPYFTARPHWDGYSALVYLAACTACREPLPGQLPANALESEVVRRTHDREMRGALRTITQAQIWLPGTFGFAFEFVDLTEGETFVAGVRDLLEDLNGLMEKLGLSEADLQAALEAGIESDSDFLTLAKYGLASFRWVAKDAVEHKLPMMLSY